MKFVVERNWIEVVGLLWIGGKATMTYELTRGAVLSMGLPVTRKQVTQWLMSNSGDFQQVIDFNAVVGEKVIPWEKEENENFFNECCGEGGTAK